MNKLIVRYAICGAVFAAVAGTLLHFAYDWTGHNPVAALFGAVNESTWEHLKIAAIPMVLFYVVEFFRFGMHQPNFFAAKLAALASCMGTIVIVFYGYTFFLGHSVLVVDVTLFYAAIVIGQWLGSRILLLPPEPVFRRIIALVLLLSIVAALFSFTWYPPHAWLFLDPVTGGYGLV